LGDEGSAFDIGQSGLRAAIRSAEGRGPRTVLEQFIPQRLGLEGLQDLVAWTSPFAKDRVAGVAPVVFEAAADGDEVSQLILRTAADELGRGIALVVDRLWPREEGGDRLERVVFSGGVLRNQPTFREELARRARAVAPSAACILPEVEGALGAVRLARRWLDESRI
jgi:N-acetylglucosamine kinase-like BadF-type ATPase